jgi:hypothetical protein
MNHTLIDAIWHSLKSGEPMMLPALVAEISEFLKTPINKYRLETELLNLVAERKLEKTAEAFRAIPGKPLVIVLPTPPPRAKIAALVKREKILKVRPVSSDAGKSIPEPALEDSCRNYIRNKVLNLGNR